MDPEFMYFKDDVVHTLEIQNIHSEEIVTTEEVVTSVEAEQDESEKTVEHYNKSPKIVKYTADVSMDFGQGDLNEKALENKTDTRQIVDGHLEMSCDVIDQNKGSKRSGKRRTKTSDSPVKKLLKMEADQTTNTSTTSSPYGTRKSARKVLKKQDYVYDDDDDDDVPKIKTKRKEDKEIDKLIKMIKETCTQLETIGKDVLVLIADIKGPKILGSKAGVEFANETKIITSEFQHFCDEKRSTKTKTSMLGKQKFTKGIKTALGKRQSNNSEEVEKAAKFNKVIKVKLKGMDRNESETIGNITISVDKAMAGKDIGIESVTMGENDDSPELDGADSEMSDENEDIPAVNEVQSDIGDDEDDYRNDGNDGLTCEKNMKDENTGEQFENSVVKDPLEKLEKLQFKNEAKNLLDKWVEMDFGMPERVKTVMNFEDRGGKTKSKIDDPETFTCDKCGFIFLHSEHLKTHEIDMMNCERRDLRIPFHCLDDDRYDKYVIHYADKSDKHDIFLMKDLLKEQRAPPYRCFICKKTHQSTVLLNRHLLSHSNGHAFNCPICGKQMKLFESFNRHLLKHFTSAYGCENCYRSFSTQDQLNSHSEKCTHSRVKIPTEDSEQNKDFKCENCNYIAPDMTTLVIHQTHHSKSTVVQCPMCEQTLSVGSLKRHMVVIHQESKPVMCETCGKQFKDRLSLRRHSKVHNDEVFSCPVCGKKFADKEYLARHMCTHSLEKKFICDHCGAGYNKKLYFDNHLRSHTGEKPFACTVQESRKRNYDRADLLKAFEATQKGMSVYKASRLYGVPESTLRDRTRFKVALDARSGPSRIFTDDEEKYLVKHIKNMSDVGFGYAKRDIQRLATDFAKLSGKDRDCENNMSDHWFYGFVKRWPELKVKLPKTPQRSRKKKGQQPGECCVSDLGDTNSTEGCDKKFRCVPNLRQHMRSHNVVGEFVCDYCGKRFKQRGQLSRHRKSHTVEFGWACVYCPEKFKSCWKYKQHLVHKHPEKKEEIEQTTNIRLHKCHICGKLYHDTEDLQRHVNAHNGIKPFKCSYCNKGFVDRSNLKAHEHIHKGTVKFKCRICYKSFLQENNLQKHMKSNHPEMFGKEGNSQLLSKIDNIPDMVPKVESKMPDVLQRIIASRNDNLGQQSTEIVIDCLDNYQLQILETEETILS